MSRKQISPARKRIYYSGLILIAVGALSFGSVFVSFALNFGSNSDSIGRSMAIRGFFGMGLMMAGIVLAGIGRVGAAGSGLVLDPEKARQDVEPWSRMSGGMVKDALDEAGISLGREEETAALPFDEQLRRLHRLREDGILSEEEYQAKKRQILERA